MQSELNDFTPFGYLRNPAHRARAWSDTSGGNLRAAADRLGVEWVYPVGRDATSRAGLAIETVIDGRACLTRGDFDAIGMACRHHTCLMIGFEFSHDGITTAARFFLANDDVMAARIALTNRAAQARDVHVVIVEYTEGDPPERHVLVGPGSIQTRLEPGQIRVLIAAIGRGSDHDQARQRGEIALERADATYQRLVDEDARFLAACPALTGDWPAHWREGLHHDFQTTRMLVQPAGGVFKDVWPAWMAAWPRVVLAEGTLDMLRLAYADAAVAKRAVLSLLRDASAPNIPCVFRDGEYNMVAADGSRCGTSPAWCLPFLNLKLLYLQTLDRGWLRQVYPLAGGYLEWWRANRTDAHGWIVYKCTWESGEDGNPRLDPTGSGDADISDRVRPVELQATLAHAAGVMAFFADELGLDSSHWREMEREYRRRTERLFDPVERRFRDWLIAENRFQPTCPERPYWGVDACRDSAQSLTPLLIGLPIDEIEVDRHFAAPWTLWPSWTWSLVEAAAAAGLYRRAGQLSFESVDRVYRATTRRELGSFARPMPGSSPEFWPEDWRTYGGSDAYGWGATTANLLIRHLFGLKESDRTDGWVLDLTPAFPTAMLHAGARYGLRNLAYRGRQFDLTYVVQADVDAVEVQLDMPGHQQSFRMRIGERYALQLA